MSWWLALIGVAAGAGAVRSLRAATVGSRSPGYLTLTVLGCAGLGAMAVIALQQGAWLGAGLAALVAAGLGGSLLRPASGREVVAGRPIPLPLPTQVDRAA